MLNQIEPSLAGIVIEQRRFRFVQMKLIILWEMIFEGLKGGNWEKNRTNNRNATILQCSTIMICRFRCIQTIGQSMGSETSWSQLNMRNNLKNKMIFLRSSIWINIDQMPIYVRLMCLLYKGSEPGSCVPLVPDELRIKTSFRCRPG